MTEKAAAIAVKKANGRYYTPAWIVGEMLDMAGYAGPSILGRHIMENSCGDGAFLAEIVRRYCVAAAESGKSKAACRADLQEFIHGLEIDAAEHAKCVGSVSAVAAEYGVFGVDWDIGCADALAVTKYNGKMDFVVGNPPYVRVHNLSNYSGVKRFGFAQSGMTDLFIVFYEIGLAMLNEGGTLCYINPSSIFNSVAGAAARRHFVTERLLTKVADLKHYQPFKATTYTTIMTLSKRNRKDELEYYEYNAPTGRLAFMSNIRYDSAYIDGSYYFADNASLSEVKRILRRNPPRGVFDVKNGFATLCDSFFIGDLGFSDYTIPIVKASTGRVSACFFPYDKDGRPLPYEALTKKPQIKNHYERHAGALRARSLESPDVWHVFGRSQGIKDVYKHKYAINTLIRGKGDIKLTPCDPGVGVYGGLYILTEESYDVLKQMLFSPGFSAYVKALGKYKSGGYYTFSSKDLLKYLDYKHSERNGYCNEQQCILDRT